MGFPSVFYREIKIIRECGYFLMATIIIIMEFLFSCYFIEGYNYREISMGIL